MSLTYMKQDLVVVETRWEKVCPNGQKMPSEEKIIKQLIRKKIK